MKKMVQRNTSHLSIRITTKENFYMSFNKIVKNEFLAVEDISSIDDGKLRYEMFVKAYNETREHGGINGLTPSEMFLQRLIKSDIYTKKETGKCNPCG